MDADKLRILIDKRRGLVSIREAAHEIGISHASLNEFVNGTRQTLNVESCLLVARWLALPASAVLSLVGHERIAGLFDAVNGPAIDPWADEFGRIVAGLAANDVAAVLETARRHADVLRRSSGVTHGESNPIAAAGARENAGERRRRNPRN